MTKNLSENEMRQISRALMDTDSTMDRRSARRRRRRVATTLELPALTASLVRVMNQIEA